MKPTIYSAIPIPKDGMATFHKVVAEYGGKPTVAVIAPDKYGYWRCDAEFPAENNVSKFRNALDERLGLRTAVNVKKPVAVEQSWWKRQFTAMKKGWLRHRCFSRIDRNICPSCQSNAPACDTCPTCMGCREYPLSEHSRRSYMLSYFREHHL